MGGRRLRGCYHVLALRNCEGHQDWYLSHNREGEKGSRVRRVFLCNRPETL